MNKLVTKEELDELTRIHEATVAEIERTRKAADKVISVTATVNGGALVLTEMGRMFTRDLDSRVFNDGRSGQRYIWKEIHGPLDD